MTPFILFLLLLFVSPYKHTVHCVFLEEPVTTTVAQQENDTAVFRCQADADTVVWLFNNTPADYSNPDLARRYIISAHGPRISTLLVAARSIYNETSVQCVAVFYNGTDSVWSPSVVLMIQGLLDKVRNVSASFTRYDDIVTVHLTWNSVFSLNISNQEPDLWYHVRIFPRSLCHTQEEFLSNVVYEPYYSYSAVNIGTFTIVVVPINAAGSGERSDPFNITIILAPNLFTTAVEPVVQFTNTDEINISLKFLEHDEDNCNVRTIDSYVFYVRSTDGGEPVAVTQENVTVLSINDLTCLKMRISAESLPQSRSYAAVVEGRNSAGRANITETEFGTHHVQNLTIISSNLRGAIVISTSFTPGSDAIGYLAVLVGEDDSYIFAVSYRPDNTITLSGLPRSMYTAAVFDIDASGVPASFAASAAAILVPGLSSTILMQTDDPNFSVEKISQGDQLQVCITCSFSTTSQAKGCITLIHSPANQAELIVHTIARSHASPVTQPSALESDCFVLPGIGSVAVAVFVWRSDGAIAQFPSTVVAERFAGEHGVCGSQCIYITSSVTVGITAFILATSLGVTLYLALRCKKKINAKSEIVMRNNSAYEEHKIAPQHESTQAVQPSPTIEPVYESVL